MRGDGHAPDCSRVNQQAARAAATATATAAAVAAATATAAATVTVVANERVNGGPTTFISIDRCCDAARSQNRRPQENRAAQK